MTAADRPALATQEWFLPMPVALAIETARTALDHAVAVCRLHGDVPPAKPGGWSSACDSCEQPARVRKALAYLRALVGEPPPPRRYEVDATDATGRPHRVSGLYRVEKIQGLWAPADEEQAREVILRELDVRGERGPFDVVVTIKRGDHAR
jgi:hypothetical protein